MTERDELLVEVNLSQWGYNDPYELGVGLRDAEGEKEWKRSKLSSRKREREWQRCEEGRMSNGGTEWKR